ncbi:hypothetical protein EON65_24925 [archaeon]|nr:MAG: hypothetical protein EON65_24925 [archaeon]
MPKGLRAVFSAIHAGDLLCVLFVHFSLRPLLRFAHKMQVILYEMLAMGKPYEYKRSIIGFIEDRAGLLVKLMTCNYIVKLVCSFLIQLGFKIPPDLPILLSSITYSLYAAQFVDLFKTQFMKTFVPQVAESRRQTYVLDKSSSVVIWVIAV